MTEIKPVKAKSFPPERMYAARFQSGIPCHVHHYANDVREAVGLTYDSDSKYGRKLARRYGWRVIPVMIVPVEEERRGDGSSNS